MATKLGESTLYDAAQHLRFFVDEVRDYAVLMLDANGTVMTWNAGAKAIKGYDAREIVGRSFTTFYTPDDIKAGKPEQGLREAAAKGRFHDVGERVRKNGSRFLADVVITPIFGKRRKLLGFGKITRDISVLEEANSRLKASEARLQTLVDTVLDTLVDGLIIIDSKGRIQLFNRACERLFGYTRAEMTGKNVRMLMPPDVSAQHDQYLRNYQKTGIRKIIGISREVVGQRRDGTTFAMHLAVGETSHLGQPIYVGVVRDLTERNRTEDQLRQAQKMEAVGQLTGGIAHDFNNILMILLVHADALLEDTKLSAAARRRIEQISKASGRAAELTKQLLAFSRKQQLNPQPTNLNDLVFATGKLLRRSLGENIQMRSVLAPDLGTVSVDRAQLEAALVNLSVNARDAMPSGGHLLIETSNVTFDDDYVAYNLDIGAGPYVMLAVTDTGTGMAPDVIDRVFEPFFTTKEVGKGTGLGLSMVYGFTKQSNGHIKIYSEVGKGTTIRLYLPRIVDPKTPAVAEAPVSLPTGRERILLVEDDEQVRGGVAQQLSSLGYDVTEAADAASGLAIFETAGQPYDLLLTDIVMPGPFGGKKLAEEATRRQPGIPIVFMSGYSEEALANNADLKTQVRLLTKPFRKHELAGMIRSALDTSTS